MIVKNINIDIFILLFTHICNVLTNFVDLLSIIGTNTNVNNTIIDIIIK